MVDWSIVCITCLWTSITTNLIGCKQAALSGIFYAVSVCFSNIHSRFGWPKLCFVFAWTEKKTCWLSEKDAFLWSEFCYSEFALSWNELKPNRNNILVTWQTFGVCLLLFSLDFCNQAIGSSERKYMVVTWLILPVVICLSQRLSHACLSINKFIQWNCEWLIKSVIIYLIFTYYLDNRGNSRANTCVHNLDFWKRCTY